MLRKLEERGLTALSRLIHQLTRLYGAVAARRIVRHMHAGRQEAECVMRDTFGREILVASNSYGSEYHTPTAKARDRMIREMMRRQKS